MERTGRISSALVGKFADPVEAAVQQRIAAEWSGSGEADGCGLAGLVADGSQNEVHRVWLRDGEEGLVAGGAVEFQGVGGCIDLDGDVGGNAEGISKYSLSGRVDDELHRGLDEGRREILRVGLVII